MRTISANQLDFAWNRRGTGELLVCVHGAVGDFRTWGAQMDPFAERYDTVVYSRRWHYPTRVFNNGAAYTAEIHAADLVAILGELGQPAHLVGHSYGGAVCAVVALQRPDLVRSLVLAEASLFTLLLTSAEGVEALTQSAEAMSQVPALLRQGKSAEGLRAFLEVILGRGGYNKLTAEALQVMTENLHTVEPMLNGMNAGAPFKVEHAAQIRVPTLVLRGEKSPPMFTLTSDILAASIPNAQKLILPGISHGLQLESPTAFNAAVLRFLAAR